MAFTINIKVEGADEIIKKLNKIKSESKNAVPKITENMALATQIVAQIQVIPHNVSGNLQKSIMVINEHSYDVAKSIVTTNSPYAKYHHYGATGKYGMWTASVNDPNVDQEELAKKGYEPKMFYYRGFPELRYQFYAYEGNEFMINAFNDTIRSNFSNAKSKYAEAILRGIN